VQHSSNKKPANAGFLQQGVISMITRRQFVTTSGASLLVAPFAAHSKPHLFNRPLGLQLFAVRAELAQDFHGTLKRVADAGFREIEFAGYHGKSAEEIRSAADALNLRCISGHHGGSDLETRSSEILDFAAKLGLQYIVCSTPKSLNPESKKLSWNDFMHSFTQDDWKANAELFNRFGEQAKKFNIQFAYHNYYTEFHQQHGSTPYDELMRQTDRHLVKIELDCGWAEVAGVSSLAMLNKYRDRVVTLHLKDLKTKPTKEHPESIPNVPLGEGIMDWPVLLRTASQLHINHYFLEQEPPYIEPIFDSLRASVKYLSNVTL